MNCIQHDLRAFEIERHQVTLPDFCELRSYGDTFLLLGVDLTAERYQAIKAGLPEEIQKALVGWRRVARCQHG